MHRDSTLIYDGPDTEIIDNTQLIINTVYEYSVVATSCGGNSTAGVNSISIGGESIHSVHLYFEFIHCYLGYTLTSPLLSIILSLVATYSWVS